MSMIKYQEEWYNSLQNVIKQRTPPHITLEELIKVVEYKLKRGKFRPGLLQHVAKNSPDTVISVTTRAFQQDIKEGIKILTELYYVGPATASYILAAFNKNAPLMSDEALDKYAHRKYTLKEYYTLVDAMTSEAKRCKMSIEELEKLAHTS